MEDLAVFDDDALLRILEGRGSGVTPELLASSLHDAPAALVTRVIQLVPSERRNCFLQKLHRPLSQEEIETARQRVLDELFWELTYWKTPELYEELTAGERLHPGIFQQLAPDLRGKTVLDAGAGSGRATFECLRYGASLVYAVEPSPGLVRLLEQKRKKREKEQQVVVRSGRFDALPLADNIADIALSCSSFTAMPEQGGEAGLAELRRVTRPGGKIILIWPRAEDRVWLQAHGFCYVALPLEQEMCVHFRSVQSALHCARLFYAHNEAVARYILEKQQPEVPFSVIGMNPPHDYCWLEVQK